MHVTPVMAAHFCDWLKFAHHRERPSVFAFFVRFAPSLTAHLAASTPSAPPNPFQLRYFCASLAAGDVTMTIKISFWDRLEAFVLNKPTPVFPTIARRRPLVAMSTSPSRLMAVGDNLDLQCERCSPKLYCKRHTERLRNGPESHRNDDSTLYDDHISPRRYFRVDLYLVMWFIYSWPLPEAV